MDSTPLLSYEGMKHKGLPCIYYFNILGIPFIIGILYSLLIAEDDCSHIKLWLTIESAVQIVLTASSILQLSRKFISKSGFLIKIPLFVFALFQVSWLALGTFWIFSGDNCFEVFAPGFIMVAGVSFATYALCTVFLILYFITWIMEIRKKH